MVFTVTHMGTKKATRLKPYFSSILCALFKEHPKPVSYHKMMSLLQKHNLSCPDETRMHRKVSDLRRFLSQVCPGTEKLIINTRGIGYSLPLFLRPPDLFQVVKTAHIPNSQVEKIIHNIKNLISLSANLSLKCNIIKKDDAFVLERKTVLQNIDSMLKTYEQQSKDLLAALKLHETDFYSIRIEYALAKIKTYIALARISDFPITKELWLE